MGVTKVTLTASQQIEEAQHVAYGCGNIRRAEFALKQTSLCFSD
jgi:hypothetical protein